jgi:thiamine-monophosphate kinase
MGEFDVIAKYFYRAPKKALLGGGDDCALIQPTLGMTQCISSDMLVEGRHFLSTVDPYRLGKKALAVNLSDLAACGATPQAFTLALSLSGLDSNWLESFSNGIWDMAQEYEIDLIGGDTTKGPLTICITVLGEVPNGQALLRSGAKVGDDIYVSGTVGDAKFALEVFRGFAGAGEKTFERIRARLEQPTPRTQLGLALRGTANACIDVSDGLVGDLGHILRRSAVGAILNTDWVESSSAISQDLAALDFSTRLGYAMSGGDDYELLFTSSKSARPRVQEVSRAVQVPLTRIGEITKGLGLRVMDLEGQQMIKSFSSFDHFVS